MGKMIGGVKWRGTGTVEEQVTGIDPLMRGLEGRAKVEAMWG